MAQFGVENKIHVVDNLCVKFATPPNGYHVVSVITLAFKINL